MCSGIGTVNEQLRVRPVVALIDGLAPLVLHPQQTSHIYRSTTSLQPLIPFRLTGDVLGAVGAYRSLGHAEGPYSAWFLYIRVSSAHIVIWKD